MRIENDKESTVRVVGGMTIPKMQAIIDTSEIQRTSIPNIQMFEQHDGVGQRGAPIPQLQPVSSTPGKSTGSDQSSNVQSAPSAGDSGGSKGNTPEK
jgi:hypothetical protein